MTGQWVVTDTAHLACVDCMTEASHAKAMAMVSGSVSVTGGKDSTGVGGDYHWATVARMYLSPDGFYVQRHAHDYHENRKPEPELEFRIASKRTGTPVSGTMSYADAARHSKDNDALKIQKRLVGEWEDRL